MKSEELMARYPAERKRIVAAAARLVGADEAEDVADEALLRALAAVDGFRGEAALGTWLHRIAINCAYDHLRRRKHAANLPPELQADSDEPLQGDDDPIEQRQMSQCVQEVLATLPLAQRRLIVESDILDKTAPEIAAESGITPGNAKVRLHRARHSLKAALAQRCDFHRCDGGVLRCTPKRESK